MGSTVSRRRLPSYPSRAPRLTPIFRRQVTFTQMLGYSIALAGLVVFKTKQVRTLALAFEPEPKLTLVLAFLLLQEIVDQHLLKIRSLLSR
jgi:hypothetical protein